MSSLFTPLRIKHVSFPNRVVMPPMVTGLGNADGLVTEAVLEHYGRRAAAGTGLILVEATAVSEGGRAWLGGLGAYSDAQIEGLARLVERIHRHGGVAGIQLVHGGPQADAALCGGETVGPSAVSPSPKLPVPRALTAAAIPGILADFEAAATRAAQAGFDIVEVHGAHGYLLDSFLSPIRNTRSDEYGGSFAHRMRLMVEVCRAVRARLGERTLLDCRVSFFNHLDEGITADEIGQLVTALEGAGLDLLHVSTDGAFLERFDPPRPIPLWVKDATRLPLIVTGGLGEPRDAERAVAQGLAELVGVGRGMMADAGWTHQARAVLAP